MSYNFNAGLDSWCYAGEIPPYDEPLSDSTGGHLGLSPDGSPTCFSYWLSPDVLVNDNTLYRARFEASSSVTYPDDVVEFRARANQKGAWQAWDRVVTSNNQQAPSASEWKTYDVIFDPQVTGYAVPDGVPDDVMVFSFDIMSFNPADDLNSWLYLESMTLEEITLNP